MLREEPLSLRLEREGRQGFTRLFGLPLAREGLSAEAPSGASLGRGASASFAEGAPYPRHGARGPSGVLPAFRTTLALPFRSEGGFVLPSPLVCEPKSPGLGNVSQEESLSLCVEQEGRQGSS